MRNKISTYGAGGHFHFKLLRHQQLDFIISYLNHLYMHID